MLIIWIQFYLTISHSCLFITYLLLICFLNLIVNIFKHIIDAGVELLEEVHVFLLLDFQLLLLVLLLYYLGLLLVVQKRLVRVCLNLLRNSSLSLIENLQILILMVSIT